MANITVRNLPDKTKESLRLQAAKSGVSLEAYARNLLQNAANQNEFGTTDILDLRTKYFGGNGGIDLELPSRRSARPLVDFN